MEKRTVLSMLMIFRNRSTNDKIFSIFLLKKEEKKLLIGIVESFRHICV